MALRTFLSGARRSAGARKGGHPTAISGSAIGPGSSGRWPPWLVVLAFAALASAAPSWGALLSSFQAGEGGWQLGTIATAQLDDEPDLEIVVPYRDRDGQWFLDAFKWDGRRLPGFPFRGGDQPINVSPTIVDLDGDGRDEILFTCGAKVVALKADGSVLWSSAITADNYIPDAGYQVVTNGFYWASDSQFHPTLPPQAQFFSEVSPPLVADVAADGRPQVLTAWKIAPDPGGTNQDYNPFIYPLFGFANWGLTGEDWSGGVVMMDAQTGRKDFIYHFEQLVESGIALGHADARPPWFVYVLNDSDSVVAFDKTLPFGLFGSGMLHGQFGKNQRLMSGSYLKPVDVYAADMDDDGRAEVLVPTTQWSPLWQPSETILDDDGAVLWREWKEASPLVNSNGWLNSACMIPVNPDHDNHPDVLSFTHSSVLHFRYWDGVNLIERPGWPKDFWPLLPTPPVVGDVDGDGQEEIIVGAYDPARSPSNGGLWIFALDGTVKEHIPVPGGLKQIPALADVNGDGSLDVVYRALDGVVYVQNFGAKPGASVSWATHRGNMQRDGNYQKRLFPPGTPWIVEKDAGYGRVHFRWRADAGPAPDFFRIYRASQEVGPFERLASLDPAATEFTDGGLPIGHQFLYEVAAVFGNVEERSPPFPLMPFYNGNEVANPGFEENDNSHWDKWFTGDIDWTNMTASFDQPRSGNQFMRIRFDHVGSGASIKQYNQYGIPNSYLPVAPGKLYSFGGFFRSSGFDQLSSHWWEWNSSATSQDTNARPPLPWPDFFTPPLNAGANPVGWTYANRVFRMPPGFPNVELRHRYNMAAPGSGAIDLDDVFFRELPEPADPAWTVWIPFGSAWHYWASNAPPATNWFSADSPSDAWPEAFAKFGQGAVPTNIVTQLPAELARYYFRRDFAVPAGAFQELLLAATCTDNLDGIIYPLEIYFNGQALITSGIEAVTGEGNGVRYYDLTPFLDRLHPGTNTMAVVLHNGWEPGWDNVAFDVQLQAIPNSMPGPAARFTSVQIANGQIILAIQGLPGSRWALQSGANPADPSAWQTLATLSMPASAPAVWQGPVAPAQEMFFRLQPQ